jgi:hypothetical protein
MQVRPKNKLHPYLRKYRGLKGFETSNNPARDKNGDEITEIASIKLIRKVIHKDGNNSVVVLKFPK